MYPQPSITDIPSLFSYANTVTGGMFWTLILVAVWIVTYVTLSTRTDTKRAFATTGFFIGIIASFMFVLSLISGIVMVISVVIAIASFIMLLFSEAPPY